MIKKKFIQSVRKLKPWTPAEKKSIFLYSSARFYFQPQFDTELKKKKLLNIIANVVGFEIILPW